MCVCVCAHFCLCICVCPYALNEHLSPRSDTHVTAHTRTIQRETERGHRRAGCPAPTENRLCSVSTRVKLFPLCWNKTPLSQKCAEPPPAHHMCS